MALNFPNSPTNGQVYTDTTSGNRWVWDAANTVWTSTSTFTQTITVSSTQPGSPVVGQLWWNQDYGRLFVYYNDGNTSQWVQADPSDYTSSLAYGVANSAYGRANTALQNTSVTLAGDLTVTGNVAVKANTFSINSVNVSPYGMMKNRIINGDMRIDQRFNGAANNNIVSNYLVDRWTQASGGSNINKIRYQQNNTNGPNTYVTQTSTGFSNYFGANVVSSNTVSSTDYWILSQYVEGYNIADLNWGTPSAAPVTLSFWVYSSIAGTHGGNVRNIGATRAYPFTYNISAANTWQFQSITIPGDTTGTWLSNNSIGMEISYIPGGIGSFFQAGVNNSWNGSNQWPSGVVNVVSNANGSFYLTGVQLEKGNRATSWDWRHYTTELQLCQRYYEVITGDAQNVMLMQYTYSPGGNHWAYWPFKTTKRVAPVIRILASWANQTPAISSSIEYVTFYSAGGSQAYLATSGYNGLPAITASAELGVSN